MKTKAEIGVLLPETKEHQEPPKAGSGKEGLSREHGHAGSLISDF